MKMPWLPGSRRLTLLEVFVFHTMIVDMRRRNWELGQFIESQGLVGTESPEGRNLSTRLGRLWQMMKDSPEFESALWCGRDSPKCRWDDVLDEIDTDYDTSILHNQADTDIVEQHPHEERGVDEEFFDALE